MADNLNTGTGGQFWKSRKTLWAVSCVSLALLLVTLLEKQNQRNTERTEQYLAASRAAARYSNRYRSFEIAADVTASVIESWIPVCCVADATANGWPDGYNKHVNKVLSSTSSAVRLREASAAADDGPAYIADGNKAISDKLMRLRFSKGKQPELSFDLIGRRFRNRAHD